MGDRHGGRFARRGRTLNPPHPQVDAHRGVNFRWRAVGFRWRGAMGRICPTREGSPRRRPPDTAHERKDLPAQEHAPRRRPPDTAHERKDLPAQEHAPRRKPPDTAHERKDLSPRRNTPLGEGLPTRRTSEGICPTREGSPRRRPPDTAHERKDLPRGVRPRPTCRRTAGRPRSTDSRKTPLRRGRTHSVRPLPSSFT